MTKVKKTEDGLNTAQVNRKDEQEGITIEECDMHKVISDMQNDPSVAFSHTISADLYHPRNMSAGVAVIFRRNFGRPHLSDFVHSKLTCQEVPSKAVVYSLVTKADYWGKPSNNDYNIAFTQLTRDFKEKGLKTLICSPMGCVRDNIELKLLAKNIVQFQQETKSNIKIIVYNQESARILRRGLSHPEFLEELKEEIEKEKGQHTTSRTHRQLNTTTSSATTTLSPSTSGSLAPTSPPTSSDNSVLFSEGCKKSKNGVKVVPNYSIANLGKIVPEGVISPVNCTPDTGDGPNFLEK